MIRRIFILGAVVIVAALMLVPARSVEAREDPVAELTTFSGEVYLRTRGTWGIKPKKGLQLYSGDKVVTRVGEVTLTFTDGAVMRMGRNSNLEVEQTEETGGFFRRTKSVQRRLKLMLGKLYFKTGRKSSARNTLVTPTAVCGLRGTAGTLSIGADGQTYITFSEGATSYTVGQLLAGEADDVPTDVADLNPVQLAAYVAITAIEQAAKAQDMVASGDMTQAEADLLLNVAAQNALEEVLAAATLIIENNPDEETVAAAETVAEAAKQAIDAILIDMGLPPQYYPANPLDTDLPDPAPLNELLDEASPV